MRQSCSPGLPYPTSLHPVTLPNKISCFVSTCLLRQFFPALGALKGGFPLPTTTLLAQFHPIFKKASFELCVKKFSDFSLKAFTNVSGKLGLLLSVLLETEKLPE